MTRRTFFAITIALAGSGMVILGARRKSSLKDRMELVRGNFSKGATANSSLKILTWNIQYGRQLKGISETIGRERPDIYVLQEVDFNAKRSKRRNVGEELARQFTLNYVFGIEFEELSQGSKDSPAYHGQAILTAFPIRSSRILRFAHQSDWWRPRWYLPNWAMFQRRLGGRMALVTTVDVGKTPVVIYNAHLEGRASDRLRMEQLNEILADTEQLPPDACIVVAGDLNTKTRPSPLFDRLLRAGFRAAAGDGSLSTKQDGTSLDWIFVRGPIRSAQPKVHRDVSFSDHFPLTAILTLSGCENEARCG